MAKETSGFGRRTDGMSDLERELTNLLEHSRELGRQATELSEGVKDQLRRTREIADELRLAMEDH